MYIYEHLSGRHHSCLSSLVYFLLNATHRRILVIYLQSMLIYTQSMVVKDNLHQIRLNCFESVLLPCRTACPACVCCVTHQTQAAWFATQQTWAVWHSRHGLCPLLRRVDAGCVRLSDSSQSLRLFCDTATAG